MIVETRVARNEKETRMSQQMSHKRHASEMEKIRKMREEAERDADKPIEDYKKAN